MKLVEKKCPKCGADLSFSKDSKEVTCTYCKSSFTVEKDKMDLINEMIDPEAFKLHFKMINNFQKGFFFVWIFIFAVILIMFILIASNVIPKIFG